MRLNYDICVVGERVVLAPYRPKYVPQYHEWMSDPEIRAQTASEELSLEEEYQMQQSWRDDDDKLTFIILQRSVAGADTFSTAAMVGDVNLFLNDPDSRQVAEAEVMVAEPCARRRGLATEALVLMFRYAQRNLAIHRFYVKIGAANAASLALFRERLGFRAVNYVQAFQEYELELLVPKEDQQQQDGEESGEAEQPRAQEGATVPAEEELRDVDSRWGWGEPLRIVPYVPEEDEEDDSIP